MPFEQFKPDTLRTLWLHEHGGRDWGDVLVDKQGREYVLMVDASDRPVEMVRVYVPSAEQIASMRDWDRAV